MMMMMILHGILSIYRDHDGALLYCTLLYLQWIGRLVMMDVVVVLEEVAIELVHHAEGLVVEGYRSELLDVYSIWRRWWL